ncbi:hypothetical protein WJX72_011327 [[Myrmecia] bisecta]|uniref:Uncharacterized protein n=1 Tax=[Myrmecia] bisecta TaxID=41462 RepID=A0AAW1PA37_9CHLO
MRSVWTPARGHPDGTVRVECPEWLETGIPFSILKDAVGKEKMDELDDLLQQFHWAEEHVPGEEDSDTVYWRPRYHWFVHLAAGGVGANGTIRITGGESDDELFVGSEDEPSIELVENSHRCDFPGCGKESHQEVYANVKENMQRSWCLGLLLYVVPPGVIWRHDGCEHVKTHGSKSGRPENSCGQVLVMWVKDEDAVTAVMQPEYQRRALAVLERIKEAGLKPKELPPQATYRLVVEGGRLWRKPARGDKVLVPEVHSCPPAPDQPNALQPAAPLPECLVKLMTEDARLSRLLALREREARDEFLRGDAQAAGSGEEEEDYEEGDEQDSEEEAEAEEDYGEGDGQTSDEDDGEADEDDYSDSDT